MLECVILSFLKFHIHYSHIEPITYFWNEREGLHEINLKVKACTTSCVNFRVKAKKLINTGVDICVFLL